MRPEETVKKPREPIGSGFQVKAVIFDWGETLMRDFGLPGPMCLWPRIQVIRGVRETLAALAGRVGMAVASNAGDSDAGLLERALERGGILGFFDRIWTARELGFRKPDSRFFQEAVRRMGRLPWECAAVGDDFRMDVAPAACAGLHAVWFCRKPDSPDRTRGEKCPEAVIRSMSRLPGVLSRLDSSIPDQSREPFS